MTSQESENKESPIEINGNDLVTLIFPNYTIEPVKQTWRIRSLVPIPYFRALMDGKWIDSKERTLTLEDDPILFTKMVKSVNAGSMDEQYNNMLDFYNVDSRKRSSPTAHYFYKKFTFTAAVLRQPLDLGKASEARKIMDVKITTSIPLARLKRILLFYLDGVETGVAEANYGEDRGYGRFLSISMNAMIATDGKIGPIEMRLQTADEPTPLPLYLYLCVMYKK